MSKKVDIDDFARRVERLCDFILDKIEIKDGSDDIVFVQKMKDDAAIIQSMSEPIFIQGLHTYVKGG